MTTPFVYLNLKFNCPLKTEDAFVSLTVEYKSIIQWHKVFCANFVSWSTQVFWSLFAIIFDEVSHFVRLSGLHSFGILRSVEHVLANSQILQHLRCFSTIYQKTPNLCTKFHSTISPKPFLSDFVGSLNTLCVASFWKLKLWHFWRRNCNSFHHVSVRTICCRIFIV